MNKNFSTSDIDKTLRNWMRAEGFVQNKLAPKEDFRGERQTIWERRHDKGAVVVKVCRYRTNFLTLALDVGAIVDDWQVFIDKALVDCKPWGIVRAPWYPTYTFGWELGQSPQIMYEYERIGAKFPVERRPELLENLGAADDQTIAQEVACFESGTKSVWFPEGYELAAAYLDNILENRLRPSLTQFEAYSRQELDDEFFAIPQRLSPDIPFEFVQAVLAAVSGFSMQGAADLATLAKRNDFIGENSRLALKGFGRFGNIRGQRSD